MRPFKELISVADALAIAVDSAVPIERTERVRLDRADGRVAAETITAVTDVPPFDRAAMDGYAVVAEDTLGAGRAEPRALRLVEHAPERKPNREQPPHDERGPPGVELCHQSHQSREVVGSALRWQCPYIKYPKILGELVDSPGPGSVLSLVQLPRIKHTVLYA